MFNVCPTCGQYHADKIIDPSGPFAICPDCSYKHPFRQLPLLLVSGASGAGKTAVCNALVGKLTDIVLLDADILWRPEFDQPDTQYRDFFETWLRVCKNIGQSGRPVVLFGAGVGVPSNLEACVERRYFADLHYLALTCDGDVLAERLRQRPQWRESSAPAFIEGQRNFNQWFKDNAADTEPPIALFDTTQTSLEETAAQVANWIRQATAQDARSV
jgi:hypothetical protein